MKKIGELIIRDALPGLNEYTRACRSGAQTGNRFKQKWQDLVVSWIREAQMDGMLIPVRVQPAPNVLRTLLRLEIDWYEPNNRRDPDNISGFGHKVILDALVRAGVLPDDGRKYVGELHDKFFTDKDNPRIEVRIWEIN